jgi:hypothetical protein
MKSGNQLQHDVIDELRWDAELARQTAWQAA